jgi:predicted membrane chloride channel (bestrophin family)
VVVTVLAVLSTHVALTLGLSAEMPADIISVAVIFPIVFSIHAAYTRREEALRYLASLRSHAAALYVAHRDWQREGDDGGHAARGRRQIVECLDAVQAYLRNAGRAGTGTRQAVYARFSVMSGSLEELRRSGLSDTEVSRANQYLRSMIADYELLANIAVYRTPVPLRAYSHVFLNTFPVLVGPHFAYISEAYYVGVGYAVAVLYSLVLVSLDNIKEELEDPFDARGPDDVELQDAREFDQIALAPAP